MREPSIITKGSRLVLNIRKAAVRFSQGNPDFSQFGSPSAGEQVSSLEFQNSIDPETSSEISDIEFRSRFSRECTSTRQEGISNAGSLFSDIVEEYETVVTQENEDIQSRGSPLTSNP